MSLLNVGNDLLLKSALSVVSGVLETLAKEIDNPYVKSVLENISQVFIKGVIDGIPHDQITNEIAQTLGGISVEQSASVVGELAKSLQANVQ